MHNIVCLVNAHNVFLIHTQEWNITRLSYEYDSEPFGKERDAAIKKLASEAGVEVTVRISHTLYDLDKYVPSQPSVTTATIFPAFLQCSVLVLSFHPSLSLSPCQNHRAQRWPVSTHLQALPDPHQQDGGSGDSRRGHHSRSHGLLHHSRF